MSVSAHDVAAELRRRLPGLPTKKLHKLLYYCQGHHLAAFGEPLFGEPLSAWDMGPVVGTLWYSERTDTARSETERALDEAQLNTVGYVVSRYGALTGKDLENLTHSENPWQRANQGRPNGQSSRIELDWIEEYFRGESAVDEEDEVLLDLATVRQWLSDAEARRTDSLQVDDLEELRARLGKA